MTEEDSVPTSQPRRVAGASRHRRDCAIATPDAASTAPAPSEASVRERTSCHQVLPEMLRPAEARRIARQPSGHEHNTPSTSCRSAVTPAVAGAEKLVPDIVWPFADTPVPFAASSGSSRSPCVLDGLRNTESPDMAAAVSSWLPTASELKALWLTNLLAGGKILSGSVDQKLPAPWRIVGYGHCGASQSLSRSS